MLAVILIEIPLTSSSYGIDVCVMCEVSWDSLDGSWTEIIGLELREVSCVSYWVDFVLLVTASCVDVVSLFCGSVWSSVVVCGIDVDSALLSVLEVVSLLAVTGVGSVAVDVVVTDCGVVSHGMWCVTVIVYRLCRRLSRCLVVPVRSVGTGGCLLDMSFEVTCGSAADMSHAGLVCVLSYGFVSFIDLCDVLVVMLSETSCCCPVLAVIVALVSFGSDG